MNKLTCPYCGSTDVRMTDSQPLDYDMKPFDNELYAMFQCEKKVSCPTFNVALKISYEPPVNKFQGPTKL